MPADPVTIARACYQAYVDKDRAAIEPLIADDFHFTARSTTARSRHLFRPLLAEQPTNRGFDSDLAPMATRFLSLTRAKPPAADGFATPKS